MDTVYEVHVELCLLLIQHKIICNVIECSIVPINKILVNWYLGSQYR